MKKILFIIMFLTIVFSSSFLNINAEENINTYVFNDNSLIKLDIKQLQLTYEDYFILNDSNYNYTYTIAISESYTSDLKINLYVYVYNPTKLVENITDIKVNHMNVDRYYTSTKVSVDTAVNIVKYKLDMVSKTSDLSIRNYKIPSFKIDAVEYQDNFECSINQNENTITFNINSYIFITKKDLVDYCFDTELTWASYWNMVKDNFKKEKLKPQLFFLNFDTNKKIDKILDIDVIYEIYQGYTEKNIWHWVSSYTDPIIRVEDLTREKYTIKNPRTIYFDDPNFTYNWYKYNLDIPIIQSPSFSRFTTKQLETYKLDPTRFDYQHSVIVDTRYYSFFDDSHGYSKWAIEDLSIVRIKYETGDIIYNARTNSGKPISSKVNIPPKEKQKTLLEIIINFIIDNLVLSLIIVGVLLFIMLKSILG